MFTCMLIRDTGPQCVEMKGWKARTGSAFGSGDRIDSSGVKRVAAQDPPDGQGESCENAMAGNGFIGIMGTGWIKPARRRQHGGQEILIQPNQDQQTVFNDYH